MKKTFVFKTLACSLSAVLGLGFLAGCGGQLPADKAALVIMTEELNELYNPFYSTAGTDMDVVGQTQISMLSTDKDGAITVGNTEPTAVLAYKTVEHSGQAHIGDSVGEKDHYTEYDFVLKNGIKFSDGIHPLTMNDVLFNMYVYLDPTYTGSTTMYSTEIIGLQTYRNQSNTTEDNESETSREANDLASNRLNDLKEAFRQNSSGSGANISYYADEDMMKATISGYSPSPAYYEATGIDPTDLDGARAQLQKDYELLCEYFREELNNDYKSAKDAFIEEEPYSSAPVFYSGKEVRTGFDEVISFMYMENFVTIEYPQEEGQTPDLTKIKKAELEYNPDSCKTQQQAIDFVYKSKVYSELDNIVDYWATGTRMSTDFAAKAKDIILHGNVPDGVLRYKSIDGIQSLGHDTDMKEIEIDGVTYPIAHDYNADGTVQNENEYAVLRITVDGTDPKAIWNFAFTVAPQYYYSDPEGTSEAFKEHNDNESNPNAKWDFHVNIKEKNFGVAWASFDFHKDIIQGKNSWGQSKNKIPVGAGPYVATDRNNSDQPAETGFFNGQTVFYKSNPNFTLDGKTSSEPQIKYMHYEVVSSTNALGVLENGQVHFVSPQFTEDNFNRVRDLEKRGAVEVDTWQLGYGYIGVNATYVKQLGLRKAIMSAMQISLALEYYNGGTAVNVAWPMSAVSWAYPRKTGSTYDGANPTANMETRNGKDYMSWTDDDDAKEKINRYYQEAVKELNGGTPDTEITFTIAGSNMYEHPAYFVFKHAMDLLNECGWKVTLKPDASALTKLSTGSLEVWAAAWGSTIDPDMYQVYHKNSTATSVLAWGYNTILGDNSSEFNAEKSILNDLAKLIDEGRSTDVQATRAAIYKNAMSLVLDLAVEMPLYQRKTMYAYNANVIDKNSLPEEINSYTSPLSRIWEVKFTA